jgi:hypothetical protein
MSSDSDHAIVRAVTVDDAELNRRLAALEAEVKADTDAQKAQQVRKDAALAKLRAQQADKQAEKDEDLARLRKKRARVEDDDGGGTSIDNALLLAKGAKMAAQAKAELARPREKGEKSWLASTALSFFFGPVGWLYAGSFREAIPAGVLYLIIASVLMKLPILLYPALMIILPVSAIGGLVYALQFNRNGKRTRLFDKDKKDAVRKRLAP